METIGRVQGLARNFRLSGLMAGCGGGGGVGFFSGTPFRDLMNWIKKFGIIVDIGIRC